jgi:uncharacterized Zn finger protein (UPF0148 family)
MAAARAGVTCTACGSRKVVKTPSGTWACSVCGTATEVQFREVHEAQETMAVQGLGKRIRASKGRDRVFLERLKARFDAEKASEAIGGSLMAVALTEVLRVCAALLDDHGARLLDKSLSKLPPGAIQTTVSTVWRGFLAAVGDVSGMTRAVGKSIRTRSVRRLPTVLARTSGECAPLTVRSVVAALSVSLRILGCPVAEAALCRAGLRGDLPLVVPWSALPESFRSTAPNLATALGRVPVSPVALVRDEAAAICVVVGSSLPPLPRVECWQRMIRRLAPDLAQSGLPSQLLVSVESRAETTLARLDQAVGDDGKFARAGTRTALTGPERSDFVDCEARVASLIGLQLLLLLADEADGTSSSRRDVDRSSLLPLRDSVTAMELAASLAAVFLPGGASGMMALAPDVAAAVSAEQASALPPLARMVLSVGADRSEDDEEVGEEADAPREELLGSAAAAWEHLPIGTKSRVRFLLPDAARLDCRAAQRGLLQWTLQEPSGSLSGQHSSISPSATLPLNLAARATLHALCGFVGVGGQSGWPHTAAELVADHPRLRGVFVGLSDLVCLSVHELCKEMIWSLSVLARYSRRVSTPHPLASREVGLFRLGEEVEES